VQKIRYHFKIFVLLRTVYFNIIELYRKVCDQFGNILYLKYVMYFT